jgi:tetratricopeptide (TPR) repeat protein
MATANLDNIHYDIVLELLIRCPDLVTLRCLIATHSNLYNVFATRRHLVLQKVFKNHFYFNRYILVGPNCCEYFWKYDLLEIEKEPKNGEDPEYGQVRADREESVDEYRMREINEQKLRFLFRADSYLIDERAKITPHDAVAFREAFWPLCIVLFQQVLDPRGPLDRQSREMTWAIEQWMYRLLNTYVRTGRKEKAFTLIEHPLALTIRGLEPIIWTLYFWEEAAQVYLDRNQLDDAIKCQEYVIYNRSDRDKYIDIWKELIIMLRMRGDWATAKHMQEEQTRKYCEYHNGRDERLLAFAKDLVRRDQSQGRYQEAVDFQELVRTQFPSFNEFHPFNGIIILHQRNQWKEWIKWSEVQVHMHQRLDQYAEALGVIEHVWQNIRFNREGYLKWTTLLADAYDKAGRYEDTIAVCEDAFEFALKHLKDLPALHDNHPQRRGRRQHFQSGLEIREECFDRGKLMIEVYQLGDLLINAYLRLQKVVQANEVRAVCEEVWSMSGGPWGKSVP